MNPLELEIYLIFCEVLFNSPFTFFRLESELEISSINYLSSATGLFSISSSVMILRFANVSKVYLKL